MAFRSLPVFTLLAFLAAYRAAADTMTAGEFTDNILEQLFQREGASAVHDTSVDGTTAGKAGTVAVPSSRASPSAAVRTRLVQPAFRMQGRPVPTFVTHSTNTARMPRGAGVSERKGSGHQQEVPEGVWSPRSAADAQTETPYSIQWFVDGDMSSVGHIGENPKKYMEDKVEDALKYTEDKIEAVDVRLRIEGHKPRTYRFEVTVKGSRFDAGTVVVSKSKHAHATFQEAVDDMHDSLKRNLLKEKEKRLSKVRHSDSLSDSFIVASIAGEDEQSEDENDPGKEEEDFFTRDPSP